MTDKDIEADLKVLRDAKKACHHVYDTKKKRLVKVPDHKTRLAATTLSRAYHEGRPVERKEVLTARMSMISRQDCAGYRNLSDLSSSKTLNIPSSKVK